MALIMGLQVSERVIPNFRGTQTIEPVPLTAIVNKEECNVSVL